MNKLSKTTRLFLFISILLISFNANAQSYKKMLADSNRWNVGMDWSGWSTSVYRTLGNVTIGKISYKEVQAGFKTSITTPPFKFIREDTIKKQILYREDTGTKDIVIYDFSMKSGDSITVPFKQGFKERFKVTSRTNHGSGDTLYLFADSGSNIFYPSQITWIEGIGCTGSFVYPFEGYYYDGYSSELLCAYRNGIQTYTNPEGHPCIFFLGIEDENFANNKINIYPNPSDGKYSVSFSGKFSGEIFIYDMLGVILYSDKASNISQLELNTALPAGIYLLKLKNGKGAYYAQKLIKN